MDLFFKENKKYLAALGGGLLFLLLFNGFVLSPMNKAAAAARNKRNQEKQSFEEKLRAGLPSEEALALARRDGEAARKQIGQMAAESRFTVPDRFKPKGKDGAKAFYDGLKEDLKDELQKKAVQGRVQVPPGLGLPEAGGEDDPEELLLSAAVIDRVVTVAVESGIEKIDSIDARRGAEDPVPGKTAFLRKTPVLVRFSGRPEAVLRMVHGLQKKGSYLSVTRFDAARPDPTRDVFEASMSVAMLRVDEKAPLAPVEAR
jgi:hypothetical protein